MTGGEAPRQGPPGPALLSRREVPLGGVRGVKVSRWLPQRSLPMVGAWCFLDRIGPQRVDMQVLPHPHTGLQTVTWPLAGEVRHRDSLGSDVVLRPGELNLMTSGHGIAHSETTLGQQPLLHALQLWVALPLGLASGPARFEQHRDLPLVELPGAQVTVFVGELLSETSPARVHTPLLGAQVTVRPGVPVTVPLREGFEHAVLVLDGAAAVAGVQLDDGLLHLGAGASELVISSLGGCQLLLLGGEPFQEDLVMWWNFLGRSHEEVAQARADWEAVGQQRFGDVPGHDAQRIPAPPMPGVRLTPRRAPGRPAGPPGTPEAGMPAPAMS